MTPTPGRGRSALDRLTELLHPDGRPRIKTAADIATEARLAHSRRFAEAEAQRRAPGPELAANQAAREAREAKLAAKSDEALRERAAAATAAQLARGRIIQGFSDFKKLAEATAEQAEREVDAAIRELDLEGAIAAAVRAAGARHVAKNVARAADKAIPAGTPARAHRV